MKAGFSPSLLQLLERQGRVIQESRGVYALPETPIDDFAVLALRWPKAVFSYANALYLHGLIDLVPGFMEISLPQKYRHDSICAEFPDCVVHHENPQQYSLGIMEGPSPTGTIVKMHDLERSICDLVIARRKGAADPHLISSALNEYFDRTDKNLPNLVRYAALLGVEEAIRTYLEVLS
ncbi:MAG: abortive phage infection protein [Eggerthellaceae bacterium]|nr:abortive phage infection protein [Eggerthellaceae bacterium]